MAAEDYVAAWIRTDIAPFLARNTVASYRTGALHFIRFCQNFGIDPIFGTRERIGRYVTALHGWGEDPGGRRSSPHALSTIRHRLTVLRIFFQFLQDEQVIDRNPVSRGVWKRNGDPRGSRRGPVRRAEPIPWVPSDADWSTIITAFGREPLRNNLMMHLAADCGLRREELCALRLDDVDPRRRELTVRADTTKSHASRTIMFSEQTAELYVRHIAVRTCADRRAEALFLSQSNRNRNAPITIWTWSDVVERIARVNGLQRFSTHTFRHRRLTELARANVSIYKIAAIAGHQSIQSTMHYVHLAAVDLTRRYKAALAGRT